MTGETAVDNEFLAGDVLRLVGGEAEQYAKSEASPTWGGSVTVSGFASVSFV